MISPNKYWSVQGPAMALLLFLAVVPLSARSDPQWSLLLISPADSAMSGFLVRSGFEVISLEKDGARVLVNPAEKACLAQTGIQFRVLHEDYALYLSERRQEAPRLAGTGGIARGSMGGFFSPDEIAAFVDSLVAGDTHGIISARFEYGRSLQDRPLWAVKVSDNAAADEDEPEVLYNALIHSREGVTVMVLLNYLRWLVDNYGRVDSVTRLVDSRELYFIPLVNPDGYEINWRNYQNTGGFSLWRKNARDNNGDGAVSILNDGVDLNRNFDFKWGIDNTGSRPEWSSDAYRGAAAFSEPETRALRDFVNSRHFISAVNFHSYGSVLINPWGFNASMQTPDAGLYARLGGELTTINLYRAGNVNQTLGSYYLVNGEFTDWQYGDSSHSKVMAWSMEIGYEHSDGFWPSVSRIESLSELNLPFCYSLARLSGFEPRLDSTFSRFISADSSELALGAVLTNTGFVTGAGTARLSLENIDTFIRVSDSSYVLPGLALDSSLTVPADILRARFTGKAESGRVRLTVHWGDSRSKEFDLAVNRPVARFYDLTGDSRVNVFDLLALLRRLGNGPPAGEDDSRFDLDDSGRVDIFDLLALLREL